MVQFTYVGNFNSVNGGAGDDFLSGSNVPGITDSLNGGAGYDVVEVNGAVDNGDNFERRANGHRTEFERLNLGNFVLDVDNGEQFEINGGAGADIFFVGSPGIDAIADFNFYEGDKIQLSTLELGISDFSFEQINYNFNDRTLYYGETALVTSVNSLDAYNSADYIDLV